MEWEGFEGLALIEYEAEGLFPVPTNDREEAREIAKKRFEAWEYVDSVEIGKVMPTNRDWMLVEFSVEGGAQGIGVEEADAKLNAYEELKDEFEKKFGETLRLCALDVLKMKIIDWEAP